MAAALTNILIKSISGKIGNVVFYSRRRTASGTITLCVRAHVIPRNPNTEAQRSVRRSFADAVYSWQALPDEEKYAYNKKARYLNLSGYNLYISNYLKSKKRILADTPANEQNSKVQSFPWNPELSTLTLTSGSRACRTLPERISSVSESYLKAFCMNAVKTQTLLCPG